MVNSQWSIVNSQLSIVQVFLTNGLRTVDYGLITQDSSLTAALPFPGINPRLPGI